jgi:tRNA nucleotidyltransferase/poly(A) polymerase
MNLMKTIKENKDLTSLVNILVENDAVPFLVGGSVRDAIIANSKNIEYILIDIDLEVYNINFDKLIKLLEDKYKIEVIGNFGVIFIKEESFRVEIAIPRKENKIGTKHTDFIVNMDPYLTYCEAAMRRDFTINSIMLNLSTFEIIDCYNGMNDLLNEKKIKMVSSKFEEDPLRFLRAIRFASRLGYEISEETILACKKIINQVDTISEQRVFQEIRKIVDEIQNNGMYIDNISKLIEYWTKKKINYTIFEMTNGLESKFIQANIILALNIDLKYILDKNLRKKINTLKIAYESTTLVKEEKKLNHSQINALYDTKVLLKINPSLHYKITEHKKKHTPKHYILNKKLLKDEIGKTMKKELECFFNQESKSSSKKS